MTVDTTQFWSLIDTARTKSAEDQDVFLECLEKHLTQLSPEAILAFHQCFERRMRESYHADLWGAAYLLNSGCSDDGFDYFRCWLISRGELPFYQALKQPNSLNDIGYGEWEGLWSVAALAYEAKSGKLDFDDQLGEPEPFELIGTLWEEDSELAERFPQLYDLYFDPTEEDDEPQ